MLSILIPIYNFDVRQLVHDLHQQVIETNIPFEILCFDDGSEEKFDILNKEITTESRIIFHKLPTNLGRARIRNALAKAAEYPYLLFMDCDLKVVSPSYIKNYIQYLQTNVLLYGGISYAPTPPDSPAQYFRWYYGTQREQITAAVRQKNPYHAFLPSNFLISKAIFEQIQFDERLTQYGHEDTLFGLELQKRQIKILHLDNPLEHIGLEDGAAFLQKTQQGIQNLAFLSPENPQLNTRLLQTYKQLQKWRLTGAVHFILKPLNPFILQNLKSKTPNLKLFDLYKLQLLIQVTKKK